MNKFWVFDSSLGKTASFSLVACVPELTDSGRYLGFPSIYCT